MPELKDHEYAALFPLMTDVELDTLAGDIRENGMPARVFDGRSWRGVQTSPPNEISKYAECTIRPSVSQGFWHLSAVFADGAAESLAKPIRPWGIPFILQMWRMDLRRITWSQVMGGVAEQQKRNVNREVVPSVYFIATVGAPFVKIGWAKKPAKRLTELQTGCPQQLTIMATTPGTIQDEFAMHRKFASLRVRADGEWFHLTGELANYIESLKGGSPE